MNDAIKISDRVYWVGAIDESIRDFHGYKTSRGTTYNAFLILGDEPILIDTVKAPFFDEMMSRIRSVIDPTEITYIISNHAEMDHSGCLPRAIETIRPKKIFASKMGRQALQAHFHFGVEVTEVISGESMTLGDSQFTFLETRMLHWPDSMFTYFQGEGILFSQDGFGMHLATNKLFADQHPRDILQYEASKYFANILMPFSVVVEKLLSNNTLLDLDIKMIAPDHGPIWQNQENIDWILGLYRRWAKPSFNNKIIIVYDTMWGSTATMANAIADGVISKDMPVKVLPLLDFHRSDIAAELLEAGGLLIGTPTINQQMFPTLSDLLCYIKGLKPKNLVGQVFGSYGWSGDAVLHVQDIFKQMGVELVGESVQIKYVPTEEDLKVCFELGQQVANRVFKKRRESHG